jgi:hypothetical protein
MLIFLLTSGGPERQGPSYTRVEKRFLRQALIFGDSEKKPIFSPRAPVATGTAV